MRKTARLACAVAGILAMVAFVTALEASPQAQVTLGGGQKQKVVAGTGCSLALLKNRPELVKVKCVAGGTSGASAPLPASEAQASAALAKITLNPGKSLKIFADGCELAVTKNKPAVVIAVCNEATNTVNVGQTGTTYTPSQITIQTGETVRWEWKSSNHTVTSGSAPNADGQFCSPNDMDCGTAPASSMGFTYEHTFNSTGTFKYFCKVHGGAMSGTVVVE
jgi:plastocyanin